MSARLPLSTTGLAILLASLAFAPSAEAHAGAAIELEAREAEACVNQPVCLELVSIPPDLEPGHLTSLELRVHANASRAYAAAVTTADRADPSRQDTPDEAAIARTATIEPGDSGSVNLTTPEANHLYVWLPDEDHEAQGGWEQVPVGMQGTEDSSSDRPASALGPIALLATVLAAASLHRRRERG